MSSEDWHFRGTGSKITLSKNGGQLGSDGTESACSVGDPGLIPGLGRFPGEGNGNPLQYSCLVNSTDGEPVGPQSMGLKESDMTE